MPEGLRRRLEAEGVGGREKIRSDSVEALRHAWPHRDSFRGRAVVESSVKMLRHLRGF